MRTTTPAAPTSPERWPRLAVVTIVLVVGVTAAWVTDDRTAAIADRREGQVAEQTASLAEASVQQLLAAVSGVSGLPDASGDLDQLRFDAYALEAVAASPFQTLAYAPVVPAAERPAFEAAAGRPITDAPAGEPADDRDVYLPVRWVTPALGSTDDLIGFDLATDRLRRQAAHEARDRGETVITRTVTAVPSGEPAVFLVHPLYVPGTPAAASVEERREAIVGYVTTGVVGDALLESIETQVADPIGIRIEEVVAGDDAGDDAAGATLAETDPPPRGGTAVERAIGGRPWRIVVDDRQPSSTPAVWWILAGTAALVAVLGMLDRRTLRHQRDVDRHVDLVEGIADLGRSFTAVGSVDGLAQVVATDVAPVLGATSARFTDSHGDDDGDGPVGDRRSDDGDGAATPPGGAPDHQRAEADPVASPVVVSRDVTDVDGRAATLEVSWPTGTDLDELTLAGLATVTEMCGQTLARARLADRARFDAVSSRLLAGLAEAAATAGTTDQVARTLVDRAAEVTGATAVRIGLRSADGRSFEIVRQGSAAAGRAPEVVPLDHPWPMVDAFARSRAVLLRDRDTVAARFPLIAAEVREAGLEAIAALPLAGGDDVPFGALSLAWTAPRRFDGAHVDVLRTIADLCASSLERARATDRTQQQTSTLAELARHLSASTSFDEVGAAIVTHATPALGADLAMVGVVEGDRLHLLTPDGPVLEVPARYADIDLESDFPPLLAIRRRQLVAFSSLDQVPDPVVAADLASAGLHAGACAPLIDSDDHATGVLVVLWREPPTLDSWLRSRIATVADICAQSTERSRLFDAEHRVRSDLQSTVLARTPAVEGLEVATRYLPATRAIGMGGDWYDSIVLEDGRLCVVVGDVSGHGVGAIATMTQVRTVVHTLVAGGMALPEVLVRTSTVMQRGGLDYATLLVAVIDPQAGTLSYVTAGHPPPLVRRPGGTVDTLTGGRHSVLGIDLSPKPPGYVRFTAGSTLVAYTDGLIERRDTPIDVSVSSLAGQVRLTDLTGADALAEHLVVNRQTRDAPFDDVVVVVVHRPS